MLLLAEVAPLNLLQQWRLHNMSDEATTQQAPIPGAQPGAEMDAKMQELLARVMHPSSQLPMPKPAPAQHTPMMEGPAATHSAGNQLFFHNLGALIGNAIVDHKQKQTEKATGVMQSLNSAWQDAQEHANGDQAKAREIFAQMPQVKAILSDPKEIKQLGKLLAFDPMNPEKNKTVYHDAAARVGKANLIQKSMEAIRTVLGMHKDMQAQQTPKPPEEIANQLVDRAQRPPMDVKGATELMTADAHFKTAEADLTKAQAAAREKYQIGPDKDGNIVAVNKSDPHDVVRVTDEKGNAVTGPVKAGAAPKVAMVENVPYGIARDGKIVTPTDKDWTPKDQEVFNAAKAASATGEANKAKLATARETFFSSLPQAVLMKKDDPTKGVKAGELAFVPRREAAAHQDMYAPVGAGDKAMGMQARFGEIQATVDMTNSAIANLPDTGFDAKSRAQIAYVLRAPNPASALDAFLKSEAATSLSDAQIDYVTSLTSMAESAQAMTSLQGIGARGSDKLRAAIAAMLPGSSTPSRKFAETQMKKVQIEIDKLRQGVAGLGDLDKKFKGGGSTSTTDDSGATVIDLRRKK